MKVIENVPQFWYLLKAGEELLFTVSCEHSFVGYDFTMKLNAQEITTYQSQGPSYLSSLAEAINYSAPIARRSASPYKDRNVDSQYSGAIADAVENWKKGHRGS